MHPRRHVRAVHAVGAEDLDAPGLSATGRALVGRDDGLGVLVSAVDDLLVVGRGRTVLLTGDGGTGKTILVEEGCAVAETLGIRAVWGRCWEDAAAPPYWPWVQALRACRRPDDRDEPVVQSLLTGLPVDPAPGDHDRFAVFDASARFLAEAAADGPLAVVIDDLHSADLASVMLLRFLQRQLRDAPVLLVATYRPTELRRRVDVAEIVDQVAAGSSVVSLEPLTVTEVGQVLADLAPGSPPSTAARVHALSEGNPFLVQELGRAVAAGEPLDDLRGLTPGVRGWVASRARLVSADARGLMAVASVIGRDVEFELLARSAGVPAPFVLDLLAEAELAGLFLPVDGGTLWRFAHGLVRQGIYEGLDPARRRALHHDVGVAMEDGASSVALSEIAHHFAHGIPGEDTAKAFRYGSAAGDEAMEALAYEQAAEHYGAAVAVAAGGGVPAHDRYRLLLALGEARSRAADRAGARAALLEAAELAHRLGEPTRTAEALVRVPQSFAGVGARAGEVDHDLVAELRRVHRALDGDDGAAALRARVQARLAMATFDAADPGELAGLVDDARLEAERIGDELAIAYALHAERWVFAGPEHMDRRVRSATEVVRLAERHGDPWLSLRGRIGRVMGALETGDMATVDAESAAVERASRATRDGFARWHVVSWRAMRALMEGRFADAEHASDEALELAVAAGDDDALECFGVQRLTQYWSQGRFDELAPFLAAGAQRDPPLPAWRCGLASFHADAGRVSEARREFDLLAADGFASIPRDGEWLIAMASLARACAFLGDVRRARTLTGLLAPFADRYVIVGPGILWSGTVAHSLGLLAATTGDLDGAMAHFEASIEACDRLGAPGYAAEGQRRLAEVVAGRGRRGDNERARLLLAEAHGTFRGLGMVADAASTAERLSQLGGQPWPEASSVARLHAVRPVEAPPPSGGDHVSSTPPPKPARVVLQGDHWRFSYDGRDVNVKDGVGVRHLVALLAEPGRELLALDLVGRGRGGSATDGDLGAVLDDTAKARYRARVVELRAEISAAETAGDGERAAVAQDELDVLSHQLASALGLGGRDRRPGSVAERARLSVTKAIRYSLRRIADRHPSLGAHLTASVRTGTYCCYDPPAREQVTWHVTR